jgi:signal transduction histidine kinase/ligand-binding sensor domain-containing protein
MLLWGVAVGWAAEGELSIDRWTSRHGLPQNTVTDIIEDADGYIWVTTFGGLARFDGLRFEVHDPATSPDLTSSRFVAVERQSDGSLFFGAEEGRIYRRTVDGFRLVTTVEGQLHDLRIDADDLLWIATSEGAHVWDGTHLAAVRDRHTYRLAVGDGMVVATDLDHGLDCLKGACDAIAGRQVAFPALIDGQLVGLDEQGRFTWTGRSAIERNPDVPRWFGVAATRWQAGVWVHDGTHLAGWLGDGVRRYPLPHPVRAMWTDAEGGLWLGTNGDGLLRLRQRGIEVVDTTVTTLGPASDGVYGWQCGRGTSIAGTPRPTLVDDEVCGTGAWTPDGDLWLAGGVSETDGLHRSTDAGAHWETVAVGPTSLVGLDWAFVGNGIYRLGEEATRIGAGVEYGVAGVLTGIQEDRDGGAWARTAGGRLLHVRADGSVSVHAGPPVPAVARAIWTSADGIWVGTYGGGLHLLGPTPRSLDRASGLCDNAVSHIFDLGDALWLNTNRGLGRIGVDALAAVARGERETILCELVDSGEGNGTTGAVFEGRIYVPTIDGIVAVDPATALPPPVPPRVAFDDVRCGHDAVREGAVLEGPCDLAATVTGLSFDDPVGLQFRYRLGEEARWSPLTSARGFSAIDLVPGRYALQVQARSARGAWSEVSARRFERRPLWWETRMARIVLPFGLGLGTLLVVLLRMRRATRQNLELRREIEHRQRAERELVAQQQEKERVLAELADARHLEAVGRLASGVGHDFNNLLMVVLGRMEAVRRHPPVRADADVVIAAAQRAAGLTAQLMTFGRRRPSQRETLDVGEAVEQLRPVLERLAPSVRLHLEVTTVYLQIDRTRLEQLVSNLVVNAGDADAANVWVRVQAEEPTWLEILVEDDGDGMPPAVLARVFEPYFTTKAHGRGTGLGMATVHGVAEEAGGTVHVESVEGEGTSVRVRLPRSTPVVPPRRGPVRLDGRRVLVVDDEEDVRSTVAAQLTAYGAQVRAEADPTVVPALCAEVAFDVIVSDVMMKGWTGPELERQLRDDGVAVPILFISGYAPEELGVPIDRVVRKPFAARTLAQRIVDLLA